MQISKSSPGLKALVQVVRLRLDFFLIILLLGLYPAFSWMHCQDANYDARNYHLYASLAFLANDYGSDLLPGGTQTFLNPLASLPAAGLYYASQWLGPLWPTLLFSLLQGLVLVLVYLIGLRLLSGDRPLAFMASLLGGTAPLVLSEAGNTMADLTLSLLSTGSVALLLMALDGQPTFLPKRWLLVLSAGLAGAAVGMKLSFVFILPLLLVLLVSGSLSSGRVRSSFGILRSNLALTVFPFLLSLLLFLLPQLIHSSLNTGSPLFPLFNRHFRSPLHEDVNSSDDRFLTDSLGEFFMAPLFDFTDSFHGPFKPSIGLLTHRSEVPFRDLRSLLFVLASMVILALEFWRSLLPRLQLYWVLGLLLSSFLWLSTSGIGRYSIPLQLLQGLVIAMACRDLVSCWPLLRPRQSSFLLMAGILSLALVTQITPSWGRTSFERHWSLVRGSFMPTPVVPFSHGHLNFPAGVPLLLLERPVGWIKVHTLSSHNPLLNWAPGIANRSVGHSKLPLVQARIQAKLLASGFDHFFVLALSTDLAVVDQHLHAFLSEAPQLLRAGFRPGTCSSYQAVSDMPDFSICTVSRKLLP